MAVQQRRIHPTSAKIRLFEPIMKRWCLQEELAQLDDLYTNFVVCGLPLSNQNARLDTTTWSSYICRRHVRGIPFTNAGRVFPTKFAKSTTTPTRNDESPSRRPRPSSRHRQQQLQFPQTDITDTTASSTLPSTILTTAAPSAIPTTTTTTTTTAPPALPTTTTTTHPLDTLAPHLRN